MVPHQIQAMAFQMDLDGMKLIGRMKAKVLHLIQVMVFQMGLDGSWVCLT